MKAKFIVDYVTLDCIFPLFQDSRREFPCIIGNMDQSQPGKIYKSFRTIFQWKQKMTIQYLPLYF